MARDVIEELRELAENDFYVFMELVNPMYMYGEIHEEVATWLMKTSHPNQLLLLPRAHLKSHIMACWCAWWITKNPETSILYLSATAELAESQLYDIKNMMTTPQYRRYWPEMIHPEEGKREKWSNNAFSVDHPKRKLEGTRDHTIKAAGLTTNTTGWHADVIVPDDVVVPDNAYTAEGRRKVASAMSQMASILNPGGVIKCCGTRYHPADQYNTWLHQKMQIWEGEEVIGETPIWDIFERVVETDGVFLWPKAIRDDGKAYGFDRQELARISALYTDRTQFYAQYYQNPNDISSNRISQEQFQYYNMRKVAGAGRDCTYNGKRLNLYAAIDFAFSMGKRADYTAIAVIGIDSEDNVYVLDLDRFKTDRISVYFEHLMALHARWEFTYLRAEVTVAQAVIVRDLKRMIREQGLASLKIEEVRPTTKQGTKEERIAAVLEPRYDNLSVYHAQGGLTPALEEELILAKPLHDDLKDVLAMAVEKAVKPARSRDGMFQGNNNVVQINSRFGGVAY